MKKIQDIELYSDSFFVGALFPFAEDGVLYLFTVQHRDKYKTGEVNTKLPGGSGDSAYASDKKYFARLEEILEKLSFDRRANLLILNQEYDRNNLFSEHPDGKNMLWLLRTMVLKCLEATGYYPADLAPRVVDIVERSEDHYQYFLEVKEWWDKNAEQVKIPVPEEDFKPLDPDIVVPRQNIPMLEFEDFLLETHCRPVEFYLEYLQEQKARRND